MKLGTKHNGDSYKYNNVKKEGIEINSPWCF